MKARQVQTKIWRDSYFMSLELDHKMLFIFYFTNEYINVLHCYECPDSLTSFSVGIPIPRIKEIKKHFEANKKIMFKEDYVLLRNAWKYEQYTGKDNENAKEKLINELSDNVKQWYEANYTPLLHPSDRDKNKNKNKNPYKNKNQDDFDDLAKGII
jgi:hypothetical protein